MFRKLTKPFFILGIGLVLLILGWNQSLIGSAAPAKDRTIIDEWKWVKTPPAPELQPVTLEPASSALLILDIQSGTCNQEKRPRCVSSIPRIKALLSLARAQQMLVIYSLTSKGTPAEICPEVAPGPTEPVVKSSVDKFYGTDLEKILTGKAIKTVVIVGTAAHGAVLNTATGAAVRGFQVVVAVDGVSAEDSFAELYTAWHLLNAPAVKGKVVLTKVSLIGF